MRQWEYATTVFWIVTVVLAVATVGLSVVFARQPVDPPGPKAPPEPPQPPDAPST